MTIYFAKSPQHALLAFTIKIAREKVKAAKEKGGKAYVGRTALQKLMYFLKRLGVPVSYKFDLYHYGPFCADIYTDVEYLMSDDVVKEDSNDSSKYSNYGPSANMGSLLSMHRTLISTHRATIEGVVDALIPLGPQHLELIATLDYLYQQERAKKPKGPVQKEVVDRFVEVKGKKHGDRASVEKTYSQLDKAGLFKS